MQTFAKRHPRYWRIQSNNAEQCELTVDELVLYDSQPSCFLKHNAMEKVDFGGMVQTMGAFEFRGKRLRFAAKIKSEKIEGQANLFVTILDAVPSIIMQDEMLGHKISGSSDWTEHHIVIDVPTEARYINFGAEIKKGSGSLWLADLSISEVGADVPLTENGIGGAEVLRGPTNFELTPRHDDIEQPKDWRFHSNPYSASSQFEYGRTNENGLSALRISSSAALVPSQGELSSLGGTFSQTFNCVQLRQKRVRFSADLKFKEVGDWCGLMMWVKGTKYKTLAYSTMYDLGLSGSSDWRRECVVLDVPLVACNIIISLKLQGNGEAYFSNLAFDTVNDNIATTDRISRPKNLNFMQ